MNFPCIISKLSSSYAAPLKPVGPSVINTRTNEDQARDLARIKFNLSQFVEPMA